MSRFKRALKQAKSRRRRQKKAGAELVATWPKCPHGTHILENGFPWGCTFCMDVRRKALDAQREQA